MINFLLGPFVRGMFVGLSVCQSSLHLVRFGQLLCCADKRIVNNSVHGKEHRGS